MAGLVLIDSFGSSEFVDKGIVPGRAYRLEEEVMKVDSFRIGIVEEESVFDKSC